MPRLEEFKANEFCVSDCDGSRVFKGVRCFGKVGNLDG